MYEPSILLKELGRENRVSESLGTTCEEKAPWLVTRENRGKGHRGV